MKIVLLNNRYGHNKWPAYIVVDVKLYETVKDLNTKTKITALYYNPENSDIDILSPDIKISNIISSNLILLFTINDIQLSFSTKISSSWSNLYSVNLNKPFSLTQLICGRLATNYETWLNINNQCSEISSKIASSMIRVAATRIFADPMQSILELPVNSIDSYRSLRENNQGSIGKFGMGFFSILYWVLKYPQMILIINSVPIQGLPWTLKIYNKRNNLMAEFVKSDDPSYKSLLGKEHIFLNTDDDYHGTDILLADNYRGRTFKYESMSINLLSDQIKKLQYIQDVKIYEYRDTDQTFIKNNLSLVNNSNSSDKIFIKYITNQGLFAGVEFKDWARGISLPVLFGSLLIPSVSTKTIESSYNLQQQGNDSYKVSIDKRNSNTLHITIGSIMIVNISDDIPGAIYHLDLPLWAKIPVSRDDVLVEYNTSEYNWLLAGFKEMVDKCLEFNYDLQELMDLFDKYSSYSRQPMIFQIISNIHDYLYTLDNVVYLPNKTITELLRPLLSFGNEINGKIAHLNKFSFSQAIDKLHNLIKLSPKIITDDRFNNILIIVLPDYNDIPTTGGIPSFIFISEQFYRNPDWVENIILSFSDTLLTLKINDETGIWIIHPRKDYFLILNSNKFIKHPLKFHDITIGSNFSGQVSSILQKVDSQFFDLIYPIDQLIINKLSYYGSSDDIYKFHLTYLLSKYILIKDFDLPIKLFKEHVFQLYNAISNLKIIKGEGNKIELRIYSRIANETTIIYSYQSYDLLKNLLKPKTVTRMIEISSDWFSGQLGENYLLKNDKYYMSDERYDLMLILLNIVTKSAGPIRNQIADVANYIMKLKLSGIEIYSILIIILKLVKKKFDDPFGKTDHRKFLLYLKSEINANYTSDFFQKWKSYTLNYSNLVEYRNQYNVLFFDPMIQKSKLYLTENLHISYSCEKITNINSGYKFTANQLINYVFEAKVEKINNRSELLQLLNNVSNHEIKSDVEFQSVSIAVNEGTSKPFVSSVLTELLQNSIDAIRSNISTVERKINFEFCANDMILSIIDYVGIPDSALLALLIPFLSSKSVDDMMSTGEMGTGFFNVYRQPYSSKVIIHTNDIIIQATPLIKNGRVYDISYEFEFLAESRKGTKITILFAPLSFEKNIDLIVDIRITAINLSYLSPFPTYFNSDLYQIVKHTVYENDVLSVYVTDDTIQSFILTNEVPFGPLVPVIDSSFESFSRANHYILSTNVIINFKRGQYVPTQSRHRIQGIDNKSTSIFTGLWYALTHKLLKLEEIWSLNSYLTQTHSSDSVNAYHNYSGFSSKPFIKSIKSIGNVFYGNYDLTYNLTISSIIRTTSIALSNGELNYDRIKLAFDKYISTNKIDKTKINYDLLHRLIQKFFKYKHNKSSMKTVSTQKTTNIQKDISDIVLILTTFVNKYYSLGKTMTIPDIDFSNTVPIIKIEDLDDTIEGLYISSENKISINLNKIIPELKSLRLSWNYLIQLYSKKEYSQLVRYIQTSPWRDLIGNVFPISTTVHELQHSIFKVSHESTASHQPLMMGGKIREFDEGCKYVYEYLLSEGFMKIFIESVLELSSSASSASSSY